MKREFAEVEGLTIHMSLEDTGEEKLLRVWAADDEEPARRSTRLADITDLDDYAKMHTERGWEITEDVKE